MKKNVTVFLFLFLAGCSSTKYVVNLPDFKIGIHQLTFSAPLVYLERLKAERTISDVDGARNVVRYLRRALPATLSSKYAVTVDSMVSAPEYYDDIGRMFLRLDSAKDISSIRLGEELRDHLSRQPDPYCILLELTGFSRTGGSVALETFKSVVLGIVTFGTVVSVPIKAKSVMSAAIVDKDEGRVIYFDKSFAEENPTNEKTLDRQLKKLFKTFLK